MEPVDNLDIREDERALVLGGNATVSLVKNENHLSDSGKDHRIDSKRTKKWYPSWGHIELRR